MTELRKHLFDEQPVHLSFLESPQKPHDVPMEITDAMRQEAREALGLRGAHDMHEYAGQQRQAAEYWQRRGNPTEWAIYDAREARRAALLDGARDALGLSRSKSYGEFVVQMGQMEEYLGSDEGASLLAEHPPIDDLTDIRIPSAGA